MIKWFKKLFRIVKNYDTDRCEAAKTESAHRTRLHKQVREAKKYIRDRTDVSADVHFKDGARNTIIVTGRYRGRDYVEVFTIAEPDLHGLIQQLREMRRYTHIRHVDTPPTMRAFIDHNLDRR